MLALLYGIVLVCTSVPSKVVSGCVSFVKVYLYSEQFLLCISACLAVLAWCLPQSHILGHSTHATHHHKNSCHPCVVLLP